MQEKMFRLMFRDYTMDGVYLETQEVIVLESEIKDFIEASLSVENQEIGSKYYRILNKIRPNESIKPVYRTNIMLFSCGDGNKLVKWSHLL